jgi:hypothetical protein
MKRMRTQFQAVLRDGGLVLEPGNWISFHEDTPIRPGLAELAGWMFQLRGRILSEVFGLENDLIFLELANQFGTLDPAQVPTFFDEDQRLREGHSLQRKIERAMPIIRRLRDAASAARLIQSLGDCREARNLMAHYACWLEPVNDKEKQRTVGFRLFIGDRSHVWELDEADARHWASLFLETRRELVRLQCELTGKPALVFADASVAVVLDYPDFATAIALDAQEPMSEKR